MPELYNGVRYVVFAAFAVSVLAAVAGWLVRTRRVSPFSALGRALRAASDPLIRLVYKVIVIALFVRVFASWFGFHRYTKWLRPAYFLTDWLVEPIRRVLPPMGAFDWSPLAAWLVLVVLQKILLTIVGG